MSLTAISLLESARRKFFINSTYIMSRKQDTNVFGSGGRNESNRHQLAPIGEKKSFSSTRRTSCLESRNQTFLGSGGRNESNSYQLARIGERKLFHELDVHHVQKVGIKRFWAQETEMSLTVISSLESARRKFLMNSTYSMSRKQKSHVFGLRRPK